MVSPGRRKASPFTLLALLTLLLLSTTASAASAVLGIDVGTEYIKAAIAKPGSPIDVVLTKDSKRKEAAAIAFKPSRAQNNDAEAFPERLYGSDAVVLSARFPGDVYGNLKTLLGVPFDSEAVTTYTQRYPGLSLQPISRNAEDKDAATVGFKSQNMGAKRDELMVEELLAMEFKNVKANAEAGVVKGTSVQDAVITYPPYYTAEEKRAIELAADLAGLRVLSLVSDGLAVGLNYAMTRTFESITDGAKPELNVVYDMGAGSTTATLLKFQGRTIKGPFKRNQTIQEVQVLGTGFDRTLGGDSFNDAIVDDMISEIIRQPKAEKIGLNATKLRGHTKSRARLWKEAQRMRQMLSANSAAYASFESLFDDDFSAKYSLTRERFEEIAKAYAVRVEAPLIKALENAGIALDELDSIILHGGAVRTPFVQKKLEVVAGGTSRIKTNVNADEAAVLGAAFKAAGLSASFRVKDIRATDISGTAYSMQWRAEGKDRQQKLFTPTSQLAAEKQVPIKVLKDVKFTFTEAHERDVAVLGIEATNLTKSVAQLKDKHGCAPVNISTIFNIRLSPINGLPDIVSGSVSCKVEGGKDGGVLDNVKGLFGFGSKKESAQDVLQDDDLDFVQAAESADAATETPEPISDPTSSQSIVSEASSSGTGTASSGSDKSASPTLSSKVSKATPSTVAIPLAFKTTAVGLNAPPASALPQIRQRMSDFDSSDRRAMLRAEALNTLEGFTYRARDYLEDKFFIEFSNDKTRKELEKKLSAASEWLYSDGVDAKLQDFKDKLKDLKGLVDPVLKRRDESGKREPATKNLQDALENLSGMVKMVEGNIEQAAKDAASSASSAASSVAEAATASSAPAEVAGDELEDDPYSSGASAPEASAIEADFKPYQYTDEDLSSLTTAYETAKKWLDEKLALQKKLGPYDDPAILVADLEAKAKQLSDATTETIMKTIKVQKPEKPKSAKKSKSKTKKTASATSTGSSSESATSSIKDEL